MTAPRTAGSPVLRSQIAEAVDWAWSHTDGFSGTTGLADAIAARLAGDPAVVEAFATALRPEAHNIYGKPYTSEAALLGELRPMARALVAALFGESA